jgi:hypothetical protein
MRVVGAWLQGAAEIISTILIAGDSTVGQRERDNAVLETSFLRSDRSRGQNPPAFDFKQAVSQVDRQSGVHPEFRRLRYLGRRQCTLGQGGYPPNPLLGELVNLPSLSRRAALLELKNQGWPLAL